MDNDDMRFPSTSTIEHLLRIYWSPLEHPDARDMTRTGYRESMAKSIEWLKANGLIDGRPPVCDEENASCWEVTDRGQVLVLHMLNLPLPVEEKRFVMPRTD